MPATTSLAMASRRSLRQPSSLSLQLPRLIEALARLSGFTQRAIGTAHIVIGLGLHRGTGGQDDRLLILLDGAGEIAVLMLVITDIEGADGIDGMDCGRGAEMRDGILHA